MKLTRRSFGKVVAGILAGLGAESAARNKRPTMLMSGQIWRLKGSTKPLMILLVYPEAQMARCGWPGCFGQDVWFRHFEDAEYITTLRTNDDGDAVALSSEPLTKSQRKSEDKFIKYFAKESNPC